MMRAGQLKTLLRIPFFYRKQNFEYTPNEVKAAYRSASFVANNRVVFNIKSVSGNSKSGRLTTNIDTYANLINHALWVPRIPIPCYFALLILNLFEYKDVIRVILLIRGQRLYAEFSDTLLKAITTERRIMDIKPIRTEEDYEEALGEIDHLWGAAYGSPEGDKLDVLATLVEVYEEKHYPIAPAEPIEAILHEMESQGFIAP